MTARCTLYLTYYSEYMVQGDVCVGVRDRRSGSWQPFHAATRAYVLGSQSSLHSSPWLGSGARLGERLCLRTSACRIVTGPIIAVEAPSPHSIQEAEQQWQSVYGALEPRRTALPSQGCEPGARDSKPPQSCEHVRDTLPAVSRSLAAVGPTPGPTGKLLARSS